MAPQSPTTELPLTLRVSEQARLTLAERAAASGTDIAGYVSAIVEQNAQRPLSLEEISGLVYRKFMASGMTDDELSDVLETEKHEARAQRRLHHGS
ncbi:MAG TPA: hypothetical protein VFC78_10630 [Tepidisphaeraceae bacterium]|nr:hypothetical protein [Tepidisphaeraceae bacterium]